MKLGKNHRKTGRWAIGLVPVLIATLFGVLATPATAATGWTGAVGDLFTAISNGQYQHFDLNGNSLDVLQTFPTGHMTNGIFDGGYTVGCALNPTSTPTAAVNLYTTDFFDRQIRIMSETDNSNPLKIVPLPGTGYPETIVFDAVGNYYVSLVDATVGDPNLLKFKGTDDSLLASYNLTLTQERNGVTGFDISSDQTTIYYTSPGSNVYKATLPASGFNVAVPGSIFASGFTRAYGVRVLQDQNSFGPGLTPAFLMVADSGFGANGVAGTGAINVLNASGTNLNNNYDLANHDGWFAISIAAGGKAFWAADYANGDVVRFNADRTIDKQFNANPDPFRVNGLCVKGEVTSGGTPFPKGGFFVIGDGPNHGYPDFTGLPASGANVYFWGPQWGQASKNTFSLGNTGDNAFKGFAEKTSQPSPTCGDTFTSKGGQSNPPATIPSVVAVFITTRVTTPPAPSTDKATGTIKAIVLVQVTPGYDGSVGGGGTGKILSVFCVKP
jgi:hypothetical protein